MKLLQRRKASPSPSPREKARVLVESIQQDTLACLREQRRLVGHNPQARLQALHTLANSFIEGQWHPTGLNREDVEVIEPWMITSIVLNTANGIPLSAYESRIFERYTQLAHHAAPPSMPKVQNPRRGSSRSGRRAFTDRRVSEPGLPV